MIKKLKPHHVMFTQVSMMMTVMMTSSSSLSNFTYRTEAFQVNVALTRPIIWASLSYDNALARGIMDAIYPAHWKKKSNLLLYVNMCK